MKELRLQQCRLDEHYNIIECLGRGSYSEIFLAKDLLAENNSLHQFVVIKALNMQLQGDIDSELEKTLIDNFQNEAVALDRVRHPNVINRLGHGTAIDLNNTLFHYLVLEYLPGGDIFKLCRKQAIPLKHTLFFLEQVCAGLSYAHERGVIHRDIKPQNLLLTHDKRTVKIADFGVAKIGAFEGSITRVGTNIYAAPEHNPQMYTGQLSSVETHTKLKLTPSADIYSLAKTVYVMLTGESPRRFEGFSVTDLPEPFTKQIWAKEIVRVLQKATQTKQSERYQTVLDFWNDISNAVSTANLTNVNQKEETQSLSHDKTTFEKEIKELAQTAPDKPKFDSTRNLQNKQLPVAQTQRPRIVVQFNEQPNQHQPPAIQHERNARQIINSMPDVIEVRKEVKPAQPPSVLASALKRFLVGLCLFITFTSMLLATHYFLRGRPIWSQQQTEQPSDDLIGKEATTTTDVNLRPEPNTNKPAVGLAEKYSTIKIMAVSNDWCQVQVLKHGRTKRDPSSSDQGWILKRYIDFD